MRTPILALGHLFLAAGVAIALGPTANANPVAVVEAHVASLVKQLGDEDFATREAAERRLRAMGLLALPGLVRGLRDERPEASGRAAALIKELRPKTMPVVRELKTDPPITFYSIKFSRDGKRIAACGEFGVHVWEAETSRTVNRIELKHSIHHSVEFTPDGKGLWVGGSGGIIRLDIITGKATWVVQEQHSYYAKLLLTPDGKYLLAPNGQHLVILDAATEKQKHRVKVTPYISDIKLSPDGRTIALGCSHRTVAIADHIGGELIRTWQLPAPGPLRESEDQREQVQCVAWAPDGKSLACGLSGTETGGHIYLRTPDGKAIRHWKAHTYGVRQMAFTANGQLLLSTGGGFAEHEDRVLSVSNPGAGKACLRLNLREEWDQPIAVREDLGLWALLGRGTVRIRQLPHPAWASALLE